MPTAESGRNTRRHNPGAFHPARRQGRAARTAPIAAEAPPAHRQAAPECRKAPPAQAPPGSARPAPASCPAPCTAVRPAFCPPPARRAEGAACRSRPCGPHNRTRNPPRPRRDGPSAAGRCPRPPPYHKRRPARRCALSSRGAAPPWLYPRAGTPGTGSSLGRASLSEKSSRSSVRLGL